jgi:hypothetical protein
MDDVLEQTLGKIGGWQRTVIGYSKKVPQYGDTVSLVEREPVNDNIVDAGDQVA